MPIGPSNPLGNGLWCVAGGTELAGDNYSEIADRFYRDVIAPRASSLRRGGRIDAVKIEGDDRYVAQSFAGIYVLVVWFSSSFDPFRARGRMRAALPEIERLVVALPPGGGPAGNEGARRLR